MGNNEVNNSKKEEASKVGNNEVDDRMGNSGDLKDNKISNNGVGDGKNKDN